MNLHPLNDFTVPLLIAVVGLLAVVDWRSLWTDWRGERRWNRYASDELRRIAKHDASESR